MKKWLIAGAGVAGLLISSVALARVDVGISIGIPGVVYPAPVYAPPAPVYVAPAPVYAPPPPVYYRPAPVYVAPPVVYPAPVYIRGGGYWGPRGHWRGPDRGYYHGRGGGWHR
ncbi:virulence factor [Achromobacter xylosoxidans]